MKRFVMAAVAVLILSSVQRTWADEPKKDIYVLQPDNTVKIEKRVEKVEGDNAALKAEVAELRKRLDSIEKKQPIAAVTPTVKASAAKCDQCADCDCVACDGKTCLTTTAARPMVGSRTPDGGVIVSITYRDYFGNVIPDPFAATTPARTFAPATFAAPTFQFQNCPNGRCPQQR